MSDETTGLLGIYVIVVTAYFLPTIVAVARRHRQVWPIAIIDVFLGWTFIGWVVALAMAASHTAPAGATPPPAFGPPVTPETPTSTRPPPFAPKPSAEEEAVEALKQLKGLREEELITEEEYRDKRRAILDRL